MGSGQYGSKHRTLNAQRRTSNSDSANSVGRSALDVGRLLAVGGDRPGTFVPLRLFVAPVGSRRTASVAPARNRNLARNRAIS